MIELDRVSRSFGRFQAVQNVTLTVQRGEILVLIGASGSGKSTLLRLINRMIDPTAGAICLDGKDIASLRPEAVRRQMGYVIQGGGLFPHWTVERNIGTVPALLGWPAAQIEARVTELLGLLRLDAARLRRAYPHTLSGGQQQRVGVARALAARPAVLLMDEPLGALDPVTRADLQGELRRIHAETGTTMVFVTHDMDEALSLASRIALIDAGQIVQFGTPLDILSAPANDFVRNFVGPRDRGLKLLAVQRTADRLRPGEPAPGLPIPGATPLSEALSEMITRGTDRLPVSDPAGAVLLQDMVRPPLA